MTDSNTTTPSAVPTEEEMGKLQDTFKRALDSIVSMSELSRQVQDLSRQVSMMKLDVESYRATNQRLDEALQHMRTQRDDALNEVASLKASNSDIAHENNTLKSQVEDLKTQVNSLYTELEQTRKDRDQYGYDAMQADEKVQKLTTSLDKLKSLAGTILGEGRMLADATSYPKPVESVTVTNPGSGWEPGPVEPDKPSEPEPEPYTHEAYNPEPTHPAASPSWPEPQGEPIEEKKTVSNW